ncbi:MAG: U32 family peptidase [Christensenellaceae bacterium]|jgi:putative protease|nr:U32 family peptidase [Christensenellaceae bacterium]
MAQPELLAPAGDINKLRLAIKYGADAVYLGGPKFGLRATAGIDDAFLPQAVKFVHEHGKKVYVTVNIFARNADFAELKTYIKSLEKINVDAVIVSDLGVLAFVRENSKLPIHISTQANVLNKYTAEEYVKLGASRIILARELSLSEIKEIATHLKGKCEVEVFVHGAMCVSYSGRCMLSSYTTGREGNRGECAQSCRWKYSLVEEKRPGEYFPIEQDAKGTYIMNSKDLCLINHLDELASAGVASFKIEGRNKSEYHVVAVVNAYKRRLAEDIGKVPHRPYTTGFVFDGNNPDTLFQSDANPVSTHEVVAMCLGGDKISQRNVFAIGDELEIVSPGANHNKTFTIAIIKDKNSKPACRANQAGETYYIGCPYTLEPDEFLRKRIQK